MKLLYCHDNIYFQSELGDVYSQGQFPYAYFTPFVETFEHVVVAGRQKPLDKNLDLKKLNVSSGAGLEFDLLPNINTPADRLKNLKAVNRKLKVLVAEADAVVIRAVSDLGWLVFKHARKMNKPIAMEMCACAWDSTWNHGNPYGKLYAFIRRRRDRLIAKHADYVMYVSQDFLQKRYPTNGKAAIASNVRFKKAKADILQKRVKKIDLAHEDGIAAIGLIGTVGNKLKGIHIALKALAHIEREQPGRFIFKVVGPGNPAYYRKLAERLGLSHCVFFDGVLQTGPRVLDWLEEIDIYLQPSFQEGVPRATIEAMSRACPVLASTAGGIPELIPEQWLHRPGDVKRLHHTLEKMLASRIHQREAAKANFEKSHNYEAEKLTPIRREFWQDFYRFAQEQT